jgi:prophage antirepressor-like protein
MQELVKAKNTWFKKTENQFVHELFGSLTTITNENNEVFFIGKEVATVLGYTDTAQAIRTNCKGGVRCTLPSNGGQQEMIVIPERDLYRLVMRSKRPEAEKFEEWVVGEVLPSIIKNGIYATEVTIDKMLNDPDFAIALLTNLKNEKKLRQEAESKNAILMHVNKTYTTTEIAKEIGMTSGNQLNNILCSLRVQYKQNKTYVLYSNYAGNGYDDIKQEVLDSGHVIYHRKWTQLGRAFILNLLSKKQ